MAENDKKTSLCGETSDRQTTGRISTRPTIGADNPDDTDKTQDIFPRTKAVKQEQ
jgi:hypothetical protein